MPPKVKAPDNNKTGKEKSTTPSKRRSITIGADRCVVTKTGTSEDPIGGVGVLDLGAVAPDEGASEPEQATAQIPGSGAHDGVDENLEAFMDHGNTPPESSTPTPTPDGASFLHTLWCS